VNSDSLGKALYLVSEQAPFFAFFIELAVKSTLLVLFVLFITGLLRRQSSSVLSLYWLMTMVALSVLPALSLALPDIAIPWVIEVLIEPGPSMTSTLANSVNPVLRMVLQLLFILYLIHCVYMLTYLVIGVVKLIRVGFESKTSSDLRLQRLLKQAVDLVDEKLEVELQVSTLVDSPLTWGVLKPRIVVPEELSEWDEELITQIFNHELSHIQRRDWIFHLLSRLTLCIYCFNPLVWIAHNRLLLESEKACDDAAVDFSGCHISYAEGLVIIANKIQRGSEGAVTRLTKAMFSSGSALKSRVTHILAVDRDRTLMEHFGILPSLLIMLVILSPFAALRLQVDQQYFAGQRFIQVEFDKEDSQRIIFYLTR